MSELADLLRIVRRSATSVVDDLVAPGLVARRPDPDDRRAVAVELTPSGSALLAELDQRRRAVAGRLTSRLTPAELATLRDLLARLAPTKRGPPSSRCAVPTFTRAAASSSIATSRTSSSS